MNLFRVQRNDYVTGADAINVTVRYWLFRNVTDEEEGQDEEGDEEEGYANKQIINDSFTVAVKSYKTTGTGSFLLTKTGNYTLCAKVILLDSLPENGTTRCWGLEAADPLQEPCNVSFHLELAEDRPLFAEGESIAFWPRVERLDDAFLPPFNVTYWVEDLWGSPEKSTTTQNQLQKRLTPVVKDGFAILILKGRLDAVACNNSARRVEDERLIVVKGERPADESNTSSSVAILAIDQPIDGYRPGDVMDVTFHVVKNSSQQYSVKLWAEDAAGKRASGVTSFEARTQNTDYKGSLPVALKQGLASGTYRVVIQGLGCEATKEVEVKAVAEESVVAPTTTTGSVKGPAGSIESLYTRNRKASERITLYAMIKGQGNMTLFFLSSGERATERIAPNGSHSFSREAAIRPGLNLYALRLLDERNVTVDERTLLLLMDDEGIREATAENDGEERVSGDATEEAGTGVDPAAPTIEVWSSPASDGTQLTGNVVFGERKPWRAVPLLFVAAAALFAGLWYRRRADTDIKRRPSPDGRTGRADRADPLEGEGAALPGHRER